MLQFAGGGGEKATLGGHEGMRREEDGGWTLDNGKMHHKVY